MGDFLSNFWADYGENIWRFLGALLILLVAYVVGRILATMVRKLLQRTDVDNRFVETVGGDANWPIERVVGKVVFWFVMIFGFVAFFNTLKLSAVSRPLSNILDSVSNYLPQLGGAILLLLLAWIVASLVRELISRGAKLLKIDERLQDLDEERDEPISIGTSLATAAYWLVFLLFLPSILSKLGMSDLVSPLQNMFSNVFQYLPNIFGAAIILIGGFFVARIVRQILTNLLAAAGVDRFSQRAGLTQKISTLIGTLAYTVILLLVIVQALNALGIRAISEPAIGMIDLIFKSVPGIIGAALVLGISYYVGKLIAKLISGLLAGAGFDNLPAKLGLKLGGTRTPSQFVGYIILIGVMLFAVMGAAEMVGFAPLNDILSGVVGFAGQVLLGVIILGIGLYVANLVHGLVKDAGGTKFTAMLARTAILVLSGAMALRQMGLADDIVNMAFGIALGAVGIAAALAFGLGSREIAGREVENLLTSFRNRNEVEL